MSDHRMPPSPDVPARRTIAGWPWAHVLTALAVIAGLFWALWATRTLLDLSRREIVSVSLSTLVSDFVTAESRNGGTPEQASARTAAYLAAVNRAVGTLAADGTTVIVSEATLGASVPDRTEAVRAEVTRALGAGHAQR